MKILLLGPDGRNAKIKGYLENRGHDVRITQEQIKPEYVRKENFNFLISNGYAPIIKEEIISILPRRVINLHAAYLPWGKGIGAILFSLIEGAPLGVSIHIVDKGVDTGDVLFRQLVDYTDDMTLRTLYSNLLTVMDEFFLEKWPSLEAGTAQGTPQSSLEGGSPYRTRLQAERFLDLLNNRWDTPIRKLKEWGAEFRLGEEFWTELFEE